MSDEQVFLIVEWNTVFNTWSLAPGYYGERWGSDKHTYYVMDNNREWTNCAWRMIRIRDTIKEINLEKTS